MFSGPSRAFGQYLSRDKQPEPESVPRDVFIERCIKAGLTPDQAELQADVAEVLGSAVAVGEAVLRIE